MINQNITCPSCNCKDTKIHSRYKTQNHGDRFIHECIKCGRCFSSTINTFMAGIRKPISVVTQVIISRTEGLGLNISLHTTFNRTASNHEFQKNLLEKWAVWSVFSVFNPSRRHRCLSSSSANSSITYCF